MSGQTQAVALGATGTRTIPANPDAHIELGSGFNTITQSGMNEVIAVDKSDLTGGQKLKLRVLEVESLTQMKKMLEIDAAASYSNAFGISASARTKYLSEREMSTHNVYMLVHVQVTNSTTILKQPYTLKDEIKAEVLKKWKNPAYLSAFFRQHGDSFVTAITTGGEFIAIVEFEAKDEQEKAQLGADVKAAVGTWTVSANFKTAMGTLSQKRSSDISVYRNGGKGSIVGLDNLVEAALKFPEEVLSSSIQLSFNISSYDLVFPSGRGPSVLDAQSALELLGRLDDRTTSMGSQLRNIERFPTRYPAVAQQSLKEWRKTNEDLRIDIREAARRLLDDPLGTISPSNELVERVNALEKVIPDSPGGMPALVVKRFDKSTIGVNSAGPGEGWRPEATLFVGNDYKILGGGARTWYENHDIQTRGNFLTASYPKDLHTWYVRAKDHEASYTGNITAYAIALYDPDDLWDVVHVDEMKKGIGALEVTARLGDGYLLTGGGAYADYSSVGSLLTASYPEGTTGWTARCKSWRNEDSGPRLHAYAIGLKPRSNVALPPSRIFTNTMSANVNSLSVKVDNGYTLVGGGVKAESNIGHVIIENYPNPSLDTWVGSSRDHWVPAVAPLTVFAIGIQV